MARNYEPVLFGEQKIYAEEMLELVLYGVDGLAPSAYEESGRLKPSFKLWACLTYMKSVEDSKVTGRRPLYAIDIVRLHEATAHEKLSVGNIRELLVKHAGYVKDPRQQHFGKRKTSPIGPVKDKESEPKETEEKKEEQLTSTSLEVHPTGIIPQATYVLSDDGCRVVQHLCGLVSTFTSASRISVSFEPEPVEEEA